MSGQDRVEVSLIQERLEKLDKNNRWLRKIILGALLAQFLLFGFGFTTQKSGGEIVAQRIVLANAAGKKGAVLFFNDAGDPTFALCDGMERPRLSLSLMPKGFPRINLLREDGAVVSGWGVYESGGARLNFSAKENLPLVALGFNEKREALLNLSDENGNALLSLGVIGGNFPGIFLRDQSGKERVNIAADPKGSASIYLRDAEGVPRECFWVDEKGFPNFGFWDAQKKKRVSFEIDRNNKIIGRIVDSSESAGIDFTIDNAEAPRFRIFDKVGTPLLEVPKKNN